MACDLGPPTAGPRPARPLPASSLHRDLPGSHGSSRRRAENIPTRPGRFTSLAFSQRVAGLELDQSFGSTGDCYDNAAVESFFATLERELAWIHATKHWASRAALRTALFDYIEGFYNPERIQQRRRHGERVGRSER